MKPEKSNDSKGVIVYQRNTAADGNGSNGIWKVMETYGRY
jgi:hypothetical protein